MYDEENVGEIERENERERGRFEKLNLMWNPLRRDLPKDESNRMVNCFGGPQ